MKHYQHNLVLNNLFAKTYILTSCGTVGFRMFPYIAAQVHKNRMWTITCLVLGLARSPLADL
jgi:hypothetical protein